MIHANTPGCVSQAATTETWGLAFSPVQRDNDVHQLAVAGGTRGTVVVWSVNGQEEAKAPDSEMTMPAVRFPQISCLGASIKKMMPK